MQIAKITTELPASQNLDEIYQSMTMKQALLKRKSGTEYERITPYVLCRDFLVDVYTFSKAKRDFGIYGMAFEGSKYQPDQDGLPVLLRFPSKKTKNSFLEHLPILFELERMNCILRSEILEADELELVAAGEPKWIASCLMVSLYTFLLRALCYDFHSNTADWKWILEFQKLKGTDPTYAASISACTWERILTNLTLLRTDDFCGFNSKTDETSVIHHNSGFISVFGYHSELSQSSVRKNAHWQVMQKQGIATYTK